MPGEFTLHYFPPSALLLQAIICMQAIYSGSKAAMRIPLTLPPSRVFN